MKSIQTLLCLLLGAGAAAAQQYTISTVAGIGQSQGYYGDGGAATLAQLDVPRRVAVDSKGDFFIVDYYTFVIREVSGGIINTIAGDTTNCLNPTINATTGTTCNLGDNGPAAQGEMSYVQGIAVNSQGTNVYIADTYNSRIRLINPGGNINTIAGNGTFGYSGDGGPAANAELAEPAGVAVDSNGNVYIADYGNSTVRKVDAKGNITTIAGTGVWGFSGDGGPANKAMLGAPFAVALDAAGNIYISDLASNNIREITADGNIHTVVSGVTAPSIAVDAAGNIYYPNFLNNTVQKILANGTQFPIAGVAGSAGFSGDGGPATGAQLNQPYGVALDPSGNVYVADSGNQVIRLLTPAPSSTSVSNAASGNGSSISPGEIIAIYGTGLGPATLTLAKPGSNGYYGTQLAGTTVTVAGVAAPLIYTSATQVAAIVPYSTPVGAPADIVVDYNGQQVTALAVPVAASVPGVFTANSTGTGQAAAVNQNNTINGPNSPAKEGSIISLYVTGEGQTTPAGVDGKPATAPYPIPVLGVSVTLAGQPAVVTYAGGAPGEVAGLMQVNVQIPANLIPIPVSGPVAVPVVVQVGSALSQANVTVSVSQ